MESTETELVTQAQNVPIKEDTPKEIVQQGKLKAIFFKILDYYISFQPFSNTTFLSLNGISTI